MPRRRASLSTVAEYLPSRPRLIAISLLSFATGLLEALMLVLLAQSAVAIADGRSTTLIDAGPLELGRRGVGSLIVVALIAAVVALGMRMVTDLVASRFAQQSMVSARAAMFGAYIRTGWPTKAKEREGHLQELYSGHAAQIAALVVFVLAGLDAAFSLIALLMSALAIQAVVTVLTGVLVVLLYLGLKPMMAMSRRAAAEYSGGTVGLSTDVTEAASMSLELTVFDVGPQVAERIEVRSDAVGRLFGRMKFLARAIPDLYRGSVFIFILIGLAALRLTDVVDVSSLAVVLVILLRCLGYVQILQRTSVHLNQLMPYVDRYEEQREKYLQGSVPEVGTPIGPIDRIRMEHVDFAYDDATPALRDVSFEVSTGESIGIVGPSGSGKSTLFQILMRLREPSSGRYLVGDVDASGQSPSDWHRRIALVAQESKLYRGSVADNIRFHRDLPMEEVERAARLAHIHDTIVAWPDGYETDVGEKGGQVSGGQRQRLSLARALAGRPEILFLDEPTSALDMKSEKAIQEALDGLAGTVTMFIIAHRVSTLTRCDRIMVFEEGEMAAFASTEDLPQHSNFYREVLELSEGGQERSSPLAAEIAVATERDSE